LPVQHIDATFPQEASGYSVWESSGPRSAQAVWYWRKRSTCKWLFGASKFGASSRLFLLQSIGWVWCYEGGLGTIGWVSCCWRGEYVIKVSPQVVFTHFCLTGLVSSGGVSFRDMQLDCYIHLDYVYLALHTSTGFSPPQSAANYGTFRTSLCSLYIQNHHSWTVVMRRWRNHYPDLS